MALLIHFTETNQIMDSWITTGRKPVRWIYSKLYLECLELIATDNNFINGNWKYQKEFLTRAPLIPLSINGSGTVEWNNWFRGTSGLSGFQFEQRIGKWASLSLMRPWNGTLAKWISDNVDLELLSRSLSKEQSLAKSTFHISRGHKPPLVIVIISCQRDICWILDK